MLAIIPRKTPLDFVVPYNVQLEYRTGGSTFDSEKIVAYIERTVVPYKLARKFTKLLLIVDEASCHKHQSVTDLCEQHGIFLVSIPPRMTNLLQPADVGWFGPLKF